MTEFTEEEIKRVKELGHAIIAHMELDNDACKIRGKADTLKDHIEFLLPQVERMTALVCEWLPLYLKNTRKTKELVELAGDLDKLEHVEGSMNIVAEFTGRIAAFASTVIKATEAARKAIKEKQNEDE